MNNSPSRGEKNQANFDDEELEQDDDVLFMQTMRDGTTPKSAVN